MVVWDSGIGPGVWQAWGAGQDVICPPGPCGRVGVLPPWVWTALMQLHQWGLQGSHLIVLWWRTIPWTGDLHHNPAAAAHSTSHLCSALGQPGRALRGRQHFPGSAKGMHSPSCWIGVSPSVRPPHQTVVLADCGLWPYATPCFPVLALRAAHCPQPPQHGLRVPPSVSGLHPTVPALDSLPTPAS